MPMLLQALTVKNPITDDKWFLDGDFKLGHSGPSEIVLDITDTDAHTDLRIVISGKVVSQERRMLLPYERLQHADDREDLKAALVKAQREVTDLKMKIAELESKRGQPVEAAKDDKLILLGPEFLGSLEFALEEAGLKLSDVGDDVVRVVTDMDDDTEEKITHWCRGHQFQEHEPTLMADYGTEIQCPICGNTRKKR